MKKGFLKSVATFALILIISYFTAKAIIYFMPQNTYKSASKDTGGISKYSSVSDMFNIHSGGFGWREEAEDVPAPPDTDSDGGVMPYPQSLENHSGSVIQTYYGTYSGTNFFNLDNAGQVNNKTSVANQSLLKESRILPEFTIDVNSGEPQVLIMHTHTTESFEPYERDFYDSSFSYRTTDNSKNVTAIGDEIAKQLEIAGISAIHDVTVHDYPSYNGSYDRSAETVKGILAEYPSIKVVLDIHRDAISQNGSLLQPIVSINGRNAAQIMIISGCDDGTMNMPDYMKNFRLASLFQQQIESDYKGLTRPILFDYRHYNQDLTTGSLLIEVGSHGNTIEQVKYSGELIGKSIARALLSISGYSSWG